MIITSTDLALELGRFYLAKHNGVISKACEEVEQIGFFAVLKVGNSAVLCANRVGLLIGKRGTNIDALEKYLSEKHGETMQIHIYEFPDEPIKKKIFQGIVS